VIDLFSKYADDPAAGPELDAAMAALIGTAGRGDTALVEAAELAVRAAKPGEAFSFDAGGFAMLEAAGHAWHAGRFETPSIAELRKRAKSAGSGGGRLRLWVLDGAGQATDVGGLQATAPPGSLFQAASQFNCLESPGPYVTPVAQYFHDYTQGPRSSISAFPGTLLRHYAAPGNHGKRFVQTDEKEIDLLADVFGPEAARAQGGYLAAGDIRDAAALVAALGSNFESIRVGVYVGSRSAWATTSGGRWTVPKAGGSRRSSRPPWRAVGGADAHRRQGVQQPGPADLGGDLVGGHLRLGFQDAGGRPMHLGGRDGAQRQAAEAGTQRSADITCGRWAR
jgi:hypothetical protein